MTESGNLGFEGNEVFEISVCRVILKIYNTANPIRPKIFNISNFIFNNDVNNFLQNPTIEPCTLHKKMKFSIKISSLNMTKSARNCRFGHIY